MRAVCIVGPSDSGKTSLLETLLERLEGRVATVKSIHHDVSFDTEGTDTHRHRLAGAETVVGITPSVTVSMTPGGKREPGREAGVLGDDPELRALEGALESLEARGVDVVLIEGYTDAPLPAIVVGAGREPAGPVVGRGGEDLSRLRAAVVGVLEWREAADRHP